MDFSTYDPEKFLDVGDGYLLDLEAAKGNGFDNDTNSINDTGSESSDSADEENAEDTTVAAAGSIAEAHRAVNEKKQELLDSKVKHWIFTFSDGSAMTKVKDSIRALNGLMEGSMPRDKKGFSASLGQIRQGYHTMIECCQNYVTYIESKGKGKRGSGARRLELVKDILAQSLNELSVFEMSSIDLYEQNKNGGSWDNILYNARAEKISENDSSIKKMGAGTSTIYRKENGNGSTSYIKAEENLSNDGLWLTYIDEYAASGMPGAAETAKVIRDAYMKARESDGFGEESESTREQENSVCDMIDALGKVMNNAVSKGRKKGEDDRAYKMRIDSEVDKDLRSKAEDLYYDYISPKAAEYIKSHFDQFLDLVKYTYKKHNEFDVSTMMAGIDAGSAISNRNVSTSRMAERYGMSDAVAESKTVLIEQDNGSVTRANSMEGIEGMPMGELGKIAKANGFTITFSANAMRQMMELQVFDLICGQIDRHQNNYVPAYTLNGEKEYEVTSIKAIDNDMSFGSGIKSVAEAYSRQRTLVDSDDNVTVPYLPEDFYNNVMAYTPEMAIHDQMDIRSQKELEALGARITDMQNQLKTLVANKRITLLKTDEEWEEARKVMLNMKRNGKLEKGYLAEALLV